MSFHFSFACQDGLCIEITNLLKKCRHKEDTRKTTTQSRNTKETLDDFLNAYDNYLDACKKNDAYKLKAAYIRLDAEQKKTSKLIANASKGATPEELTEISDFEKRLNSREKLPADGCKLLQCRICSQVATHLCGSCNVASYCGRQCQEADWKVHKFNCPQ